MEKDVLVILMVAFGLFAIVMFILFFIYLKKYYNNKHISDDYKKDIDEGPAEEDMSDEAIWGEPKKEEVSFEKEYANIKAVDIQENDSYDGEEFIPIKKK